MNMTSNPGPSGNLVTPKWRRAGITLIEVLITSALSTVLLAILYSSLDVASQVSARAETRGTHDALVRALKKRIEWDLQNAVRRPTTSHLTSLASHPTASISDPDTSTNRFARLAPILGCGDLLLLQTSPREQVNLQQEHGLQSQLTYYAYFVVSSQAARPISRRLRDLNLTAGPRLASLQHTHGLHRYLLHLDADSSVAEIIQIDPDYQRPDFASLSVDFFDGHDWGQLCMPETRPHSALRCSLAIRAGNNRGIRPHEPAGNAPSQPRSKYAFTIAID